MGSNDFEGSDGGPLPGRSRQYVAVQFPRSANRTYTYHNDGEPVLPGDTVQVDTRDGTQAVTVVRVEKMPPFATKPIIGKVLA